MKFADATVWLLLSWFFTISSSLILCSCPLWPAFGVVLSGIVVWRQRKAPTLAAALALIASVIATSYHTVDKVREHHARESRIERLGGAPHNSSSPTTNR